MALQKSFSNFHPLVLFWIGVLTGALAIGLVFFYKTLIPADYESASVKYQYSVPKATKSSPGYQQKAGTTKKSSGSVNIGTPDGN